MNFVSKKFWYKHIPASYTTILTREALIVLKINQGIPQEDLERYCKPKSIAKYMELDNFYPISIDKSLDWCKDLSTGEDVEYKDCFTDKYDHKCWGMVRKGTTVRHGLFRFINPKFQRETAN